MTKEELLARIAELEAENESLRHNRRYKNAIPKKLIEEYPCAKVFWHSEVLYPISKSIRYMCFPREKKETIARSGALKGKLTKMDCTISLLEMSDEQYEKYCACLEGVIKAFEPYLDDRFKEKL